MTKQQLRQYRALAAELKDLENRIQELETRLTSPRSPRFGDGRYSRCASGLEEGVVKLADLTAIYDEKVAGLHKTLVEIETALNGLENSTERRLMRLRYVDGLTWNEICLKIGYEWAQVHRLHSKILKKIKHDTQ